MPGPRPGGRFVEWVLCQLELPSVSPRDQALWRKRHGAATILYAPAPAFRSVSVEKLARLVYDGSHQVGEKLARALIEAAT